MFNLKGVVPPMITPFDQDGELDLAQLEVLVDFLKDRVDGLFICGSYGCGAMMSVAERKTVAEVCLRTAKGKVPIIVQTGTTTTRDTVELTRHAQEIGCQGAAAVGPYYFHHQSDSVLGFYRAMLKAVEPDFPIYLYDNPTFSGYSIALDVLKQLKEEGLKGVKDATFDILTFAKYQRELGGDGFEVILGTEAMWLPAFCLGAEAFIPGLANAFPEICGQMFRQSQEGDLAGCRETQFRINKVRDIMYLARSTQLAVYAMLDIRGIVTAFPRAPFIPATEAEKDKIRRALTELEML